jgi:hypothetical protein
MQSSPRRDPFAYYGIIFINIVPTMLIVIFVLRNYIGDMRCCTAPKKEFIMSPLNIAKIEQEARQMRADEMQRISGLISARLVQYGQLLAATGKTALGAVASMLRPLFAWNPQAPVSHPSTAAGPSVLTRLSVSLRGLFSWNPQAHRS